MNNPFVDEFLRWSKVDKNIFNDVTQRERADNWLQSFKRLCLNCPQALENLRLQEEVIHMSLLIKITVTYITEYLELCEKYINPDVVLEIMDKHPMMQDYYMGNNRTIRNYLTIVG